MKDSILTSHSYHRSTSSKHIHDTFLSKILEIAFESLIRALIPTYSFLSPIRLGFSNRRLYLVPQFFANKPVEHLLGPGIEAADLNDDCLDRTLDWLYAQDPTQVFAGIATQARGECASRACGYDFVFRQWGI